MAENEGLFTKIELKITFSFLSSLFLIATRETKEIKVLLIETFYFSPCWLMLHRKTAEERDEELLIYGIVSLMLLLF